MPITIGWHEIALRLALTVLAGSVIGFNRGEHGRPAGMRTTLLVCLAASLSMLQANLLMQTVGKAHDSFVVLDLMRLPLGVLSGMGFIGAGTILRKQNLVLGVTTAATLWFVTLMGLCFGGGQIGLGLTALALGWATLWGLKYVELLMHQEVQVSMHIVVLQNGPNDDRLRDMLQADGCTIKAWGVSYSRTPAMREIYCAVRWRPPRREVAPPGVIDKLRDDPAIVKLCWYPQGIEEEIARPQNQPAGTPIPISPGD